MTKLSDDRENKSHLKCELSAGISSELYFEYQLLDIKQFAGLGNGIDTCSNNW